MNYGIHCSQYKKVSILTNIMTTFSQDTDQILTTFSKILTNIENYLTEYINWQDPVTIFTLLGSIEIQIPRLFLDLVVISNHGKLEHTKDLGSKV